MTVKQRLTGLLHTCNFDLSPTQGKVCIPIIERICKKMSCGLMFPSISFDDDVIIDGHHRYLAAHLIGFDLDRVQGIRSSAKLKRGWRSIELVEEDWDTPTKVAILDQRDAEYNGLTVNELTQLLS